jgi:quinol monooxygenase YgiN
MLTVVALIQAVPGKSALVKAELEKLTAATRMEDGCVQYDLHQDNADPHRFLFYENWASRELWQAHMASAHLAAYRRATEGALAGTTLWEMSRLG